MRNVGPWGLSTLGLAQARGEEAAPWHPRRNGPQEGAVTQRLGPLRAQHRRHRLQGEARRLRQKAPHHLVVLLGQQRARRVDDERSGPGLPPHFLQERQLGGLELGDGLRGELPLLIRLAPQRARATARRVHQQHVRLAQRQGVGKGHVAHRQFPDPLPGLRQPPPRAIPGQHPPGAAHHVRQRQRLAPRPRAHVRHRAALQRTARRTADLGDELAAHVLDLEAPRLHRPCLENPVAAVRDAHRVRRQRHRLGRHALLRQPREHLVPRPRGADPEVQRRLLVQRGEQRLQDGRRVQGRQPLHQPGGERVAHRQALGGRLGQGHVRQGLLHHARQQVVFNGAGPHRAWQPHLRANASPPLPTEDPPPERVPDQGLILGEPHLPGRVSERPGRGIQQPLVARQLPDGQGREAALLPAQPLRLPQRRGQGGLERLPAKHCDVRLDGGRGGTARGTAHQGRIHGCGPEHAHVRTVFRSLTGSTPARRPGTPPPCAPRGALRRTGRNNEGRACARRPLQRPPRRAGCPRRSGGSPRHGSRRPASAPRWGSPGPGPAGQAPPAPPWPPRPRRTRPGGAPSPTAPPRCAGRGSARRAPGCPPAGRACSTSRPHGRGAEASSSPRRRPR
ncbi:conserved hypothetical protein [Stigmatella aurantiaca DW4/3-1]|uniref:Uncharacterized protein n=1 Tax=Stigmatella aurantiaca (strain DW4/3-1) TaxID=378806 RepID=Q08T18_STIAD|nr:conserved hypothetical protein [Stigmatella aurantiaca DW4/3-1]